MKKNTKLIVLIILFTMFVPSVMIAAEIKNPLAFDSISEFLNALLDVIIMFMIPIITLAVVYSGFMFITAQGNPEKLSTAKKVILYTLIGATIILGAKVIATVVEGTVEQLGEEEARAIVVPIRSV